MEFLKELFSDQALTYEDFAKAAEAKGLRLADVSKGYVTQEDYQKEIDSLKLGSQNEKRDHAIELAILQAKGKNPKAIKALLDLDKITVNENGEVEGIDLSSIKKSDSYLFAAEETRMEGTGAGGIGKSIDMGSSAQNTQSIFESAVFGGR